MRLRALIKKRANDLLLSLRRLKAEIHSEDVFGLVLGDIHKSYIRLVALLDKPKIKHQELRKIDSTNGIVKYKSGEFEFLHHTEHGIISVSGGDPGVNSYILCSIRSEPADRHLKIVNDMLVMYVGYEKALCDICGNYAVIPGFLTPTCRTIEEDFILVHHAQCKME
ncbi:hypothetical protein EHEL_070680 [Encephalitozoon hellem ATCC 50504]|uniref:Uncharacterized protein n=1 Tax=Encephalitozoon hellem TaxID=27973 RepID=A0A9Q9F8E5_ENCHE|nr:uncharacterized protein EHEL_070680 [Encephalitozoon hellem ATCC 50504]AFM98595.1 hypothetical protein EHEL_070680 [Encephalitozoon hellem ATCC 50504]UTX43539.1 hypothetical protein GPU96_07g12990 [Encephalitozoon hellem]WEL39013.1 hypothetical protein PFJ87_07g00900 [Encephalitozoon hellem]|eukprot:XP_003887576.1 hypothetical protein EHEL_070680 [Encephalitozoon hellem ATCC 50504]